MTLKKKKPRAPAGGFKKFLFVLNIFAAFFLLVSWLAPYVDPKDFWPVSFFGLAYPFLLLINVVFVFFWFISYPKFSVLSVVVILCGWKVLTATIGFRGATAIGVPKSSGSFLRVMTYNVHYFKKFDHESDLVIRDRMLDLIRNEQPDVLCLQEFMTRRSGELNNEKFLKEILNTRYRYFVASTDNGFEAIGLVIFSKFPIGDKGSILFPNTIRGNEAMYADITFQNKRIRVYNVHFQSIGFQSEDYQYINEVKKIKTDKVDPSRKILSRLKQAFIKRSEQVELLKAHTARIKYPLIVCGDFNDTPASYAVNTMAGSLNNSFREKGSGFGITYNGDFPNFQIDYILSSPDFDVRNYLILNKKLSDHFAVRSDLELGGD